jgi:hypothetical protein
MATQEEAAMATFILVHGSMHGGWCWKRIAPPEWRAARRALVNAEGEGWRLPPLTDLTVWGISHDDAA